MFKTEVAGLLASPFVERHVGPNAEELQSMLQVIGYESMDALIDAVVPEQIRSRAPLDLPAGEGEREVLQRLAAVAALNQEFRSYIGLGYYGTVTPPVIQRNILENPGWYTAYTPYQAEIAQGRLEALLNFQNMVADLTALDIANASLLDEGTAAAEAMALCVAAAGNKPFFVSETCHPQTLAVIQTRAEPLGIKILVGDHAKIDATTSLAGALVQYPATDGSFHDFRDLADRLHRHGALLVVASDLLALTLFTPPGEFGADVCLGSSQRFGVPLGFGGPHAAFFATRDKYRRLLPGRLVGVSKDAAGRPGYRLALQTREQHIRRDKATSNICTAQVLLAVMASAYAVYHGPARLRAIAARVHGLTEILARALSDQGYGVPSGPSFDTLWVDLGSARSAVLERAQEARLNFRHYEDGKVGVSLDETITDADFQILLRVFGLPEQSFNALATDVPEPFRRTSAYLTHPVFNTHHSETEMLRYLKRLENRDLSLTTSMIPLGSCTMKLNGTAEMFPVTWPGFSRIHPFAPAGQTEGYRRMIRELESWLAAMTGFAAVSVQPNAGSQGEYAGLLVIRAYHRSRGDGARRICLIPVSAHGTNPASAAMAGLQVVPVACDARGNIDLADLRAKADLHRAELAALMITYPSTHGVFEEGIGEICRIIHEAGGQVYMDGANLNAQVGLCRPAEIGADVCHLNLHKTFCIPHGGGGPGVGPIGVREHLQEFLPGHALDPTLSPGIGTIVSAPYGSASILTISWAYVALMGGAGLTFATQVAIASANYIAARLSRYFPVLYRGRNDLVAHECIIDFRQFRKSAGIEVEDVAKRLMDYGFHAPTMSWPVPGTLMIEPTESESKAELDRFCEAMISIYGEIRAIETGEADRQDNVLKRAPHTAADLLASTWDRSYSRESAAYPAPWTLQYKYWPPIGRIDNVYGDRHLFCSCLPVTPDGEAEIDVAEKA